MAKAILLLAVLLVIGVVATSMPAAAAQGSLGSQARPMAGEYPNVSGLQPFSEAANFMSLPGYLRWMTFRDQSVWLTYPEARRIVVAQGGQLYRRA